MMWFWWVCHSTRKLAAVSDVACSSSGSSLTRSSAQMAHGLVSLRMLWGCYIDSVHYVILCTRPYSAGGGSTQQSSAGGIPSLIRSGPWATWQRACRAQLGPRGLCPGARVRGRAVFATSCPPAGPERGPRGARPVRGARGLTIA
jgi:hypothetical protein